MKIRRDIVTAVINCLATVVCLCLTGCKLTVEEIAIKGYSSEIVSPCTVED